MSTKKGIQMKIDAIQDVINKLTIHFTMSERLESVTALFEMKKELEAELKEIS
jgi:hypothetical protein